METTGETDNRANWTKALEDLVAAARRVDNLWPMEGGWTNGSAHGFPPSISCSFDEHVTHLEDWLAAEQAMNLHVAYAALNGAHTEYLRSNHTAAFDRSALEGAFKAALEVVVQSLFAGTRVPDGIGKPAEARDMVRRYRGGTASYVQVYRALVQAEVVPRASFDVEGGGR